MIYTEKYYTQNNFETLDFSRDRGYYFYRLQVMHRKNVLQTGAYLPMRMKLFLSLFENKSCVIDAVSGISKDSASLTVLCSSYVPPEKFSSSLREVVPFVIVEQLNPSDASCLLERQMEHEIVFPKTANAHTALITAKELLLALLLEYRGLVCEAGISHTEEIAALEQSVRMTSRHFYTPFLFYERAGETFAIPSFMVTRLESDEEGYNLIINDLWNTGKEPASEIQFCKNIDIASLEFMGKKESNNDNCDTLERGYYRAHEKSARAEQNCPPERFFTVCIPSLRSLDSRLQLDAATDVSAPVLCHEVV